MASVEANGITIEYELDGDGEPLLLVMGLSGQLIDWPKGFVDELVTHGFRVIRYDNRDIGLSAEIDAPVPTRRDLAKLMLGRRRSAPYTLDDMAADGVGLLDALDIDRAHVVGVSMGGMIAQTIAIAHPTRVRSLTSIMSNTGNRLDGRPSRRLGVWLARRKPPMPETAVERSVDLFRRISGPNFDEAEFRPLAEASVARSVRPAGSMRQVAAVLASSDRREGLRRVTVPTLVVHGLCDPLVRPSGGIATAAAVPGSRLLMFNDMGHDLPETRWAEIAVAIRSNADRAVGTEAHTR